MMEKFIFPLSHISIFPQIFYFPPFSYKVEESCMHIQNHNSCVQLGYRHKKYVVVICEPFPTSQSLQLSHSGLCNGPHVQELKLETISRSILKSLHNRNFKKHIFPLEISGLQVILTPDLKGKIKYILKWYNMYSDLQRSIGLQW